MVVTQSLPTKDTGLNPAICIFSRKTFLFCLLQKKLKIKKKCAGNGTFEKARSGIVDQSIDERLLSFYKYKFA